MSVSRNATSEWWARLVILGYGVVLTLPVGWSGFVITDDSLNHLIMSRHFTDQLWAGDWYPRWLYGMNAGLGSPVFQFYGPVPYYITALFRPLMSADPEGWHQLGLSASLAVIASGFTAYAWLGRLAGQRAALIGAVLYMSAPYHLAVGLYQRFAFAELWSFVWMPLVMLYAREAMRGGTWALARLSVSYALLIMTHLPTTLLFSWVPLASALWIAEPGRRLGSFVRVAGGMLLGIGLSAIYLLPAMTTQQYVRFDLLKSDYFNFAYHFLFSGVARNFTGLNDYLNYLGTIGSMMFAVTLAVWYLERPGREGIRRAESTFWLLIAGVVFFMQLYPSKPVWDAIRALQTVQFPWRFNTVLTLAMATVVAFWVSSKQTSAWNENPAMWIVVALLLLLGSAPVLKGYPQYKLWLNVPDVDSLIENASAMGTIRRGKESVQYDRATVLLEAAQISRYSFFLPRWSNPDLFSESSDAIRRMARLASRPDRASLNSGKGGVKILRWQPPHIELRVQADTTVRLELLQLHYPGWVARLDDGATRLEVGPSSPDGLLEVRVPAGTHRIVIGREPLPEERTGRMISAASVALLGALVVLRRKRLGSEA